MERLEAAMIKARAARRLALSRRPDAGRAGPAPEIDGAPLPALQIGPELARRQRLASLLGPGPATPHDILRSRVVRQMGEKAWKRLAVTSPTTQCGKSTLALNLALSLARYGQFRILLWDFDLRRPALARLLELRAAPELAGLAGGKLADHAFSFGTNLAVVPNGLPILQSAEVLQDAGTLALLDRIEAEWKPDIVVFDLPPMQGNDDALGFLPHVDCALIVAAAEETTLSQIDRCEAEVGQLTNVLGVVLNKCRYADSSTGFDQSYY